jgi:ubiquinone biosynthesis protein UbiJ
LVSRGAAERPDAVIDTNPATLAELVWHGRRLAQAIRAGEVKIEGSRSAVEAFLRLFGASQ